MSNLSLSNKQFSCPDFYDPKHLKLDSALSKMAARLTRPFVKGSLSSGVRGYGFRSTNMACTVKGELKCKDGRTSRFTVETENGLKSVIEGVKKISSEISVVLTELVAEEDGVSAEGGECHAHGELTVIYSCYK